MSSKIVFKVGMKNASVVVDWKLIILAIVLSMAVLVRDLGFAAISPAFFILVVTLACFVLPFKSLYPFSFFLLPFWSAIHGAAVVPLLIALVLKSNSNNIAQFVFTVIILLMELINFVSYSFDVEVNKYIVYGIMVAMFFFILFEDSHNTYLLSESIKWYVIGTSIVITVIIVHYITLFGFSEMLMGGMRIGGDEGVFRMGQSDTTRYASMNANSLAYYSIVAFSLVLVVKDVFKVPAIRWFFIGFLFFAGMLTTSRTWLLITAIVLILFAILSEAKSKIGFILFVGLVLFASIKFSNYYQVFSSRFEERMTRDNIETAGLRTDLFKAYNDFMIDNKDYLAIGTGAVYYNKVCGLPNSVHSGLQQIFVSYGIIGSILFLCIALYFFKRYVRRKKISFIYYVPLLACFLFDQTIQFLNPVQLMFPFLASVLPIKLYKNM